MTKPLAEPGVAPVAALIADPARAAILCALLDAGELSAGDLAGRAGAAPNAASAHLAKLVAGGLLDVRTAGRQRIFRLAHPNVARALEALLVIAPPVRVVALSQSIASEQLRRARTCYDHLAGRLGVAVTDALARRRAIVPLGSHDYRLTRGGERFFGAIGIDLETLHATRRHLARQCMDWSERRPHLAGAAGAAVCELFVRSGWVERATGRSLRVTQRGEAWLRSELSLKELV